MTTGRPGLLVPEDFLEELRWEQLRRNAPSRVQGLIDVIGAARDAKAAEVRRHDREIAVLIEMLPAPDPNGRCAARPPAPLA